MKIKLVYILVFMMLLLSACARQNGVDPTSENGTVETIEVMVNTAVSASKTVYFESFTSTPTLTRTPFQTNTPRPTRTQYPSRTPSSTPAPERMDSNKRDGFYLVGEEIASGVWRSSSGYEGCYWEVTTRTGDIIDNFYGPSGGTMYVPGNGFQVWIIDCGIWEYLGQ